MTADRAARVRLARSRFEEKVCSRLGHEALAVIAPYLDELIGTTAGKKYVTPRRPRRPAAAAVDLWRVTPEPFQRKGKTVAEAIEDALTNH